MIWMRVRRFLQRDVENQLKTARVQVHPPRSPASKSVPYEWLRHMKLGGNSPRADQNRNPDRVRQRAARDATQEHARTPSNSETQHSLSDRQQSSQASVLSEIGLDKEHRFGDLDLIKSGPAVRRQRWRLEVAYLRSRHNHSPPELRR